LRCHGILKGLLLLQCKDKATLLKTVFPLLALFIILPFAQRL